MFICFIVKKVDIDIFNSIVVFIIRKFYVLGEEIKIELMFLDLKI